MKILVLSDSHAGMFFMRQSIRAVKPDAVIHLGDYFDDAEALAQENPHIRFHQVPGNCDVYRVPINQPQILCYPIGGVKFYMTHGHRHNVKYTITGLLADARKADAKAVLYGHTHVADCHREKDGLWVLNPGSCGHSGGSVGLIEIQNEEIAACKLLYQADLEEML